MSASKMKLWATCPLQAKFKYVDDLPQGPEHASGVFGKCVHHGLQVYNNTNGNLEQALSAFNYVWANPENIGSTPEVWSKNTSFSSLRARGCKMIRGYHEKMKWERRQVIAVEQEFTVPFGEFDLYGFIDLVEIRANNLGQDELQVIDFKTTKRQPYLNTLAWDVQFTTYMYVVQQPEFWLGFSREIWDSVKDLPVAASWYHLETSKQISVGEREDADFMRLYRICKEIDRAYEHQVYVPNPSGESCTFCPYWEPCGLPIPKVAP